MNIFLNMPSWFPLQWNFSRCPYSYSAYLCDLVTFLQLKQRARDSSIPLILPPLPTSITIYHKSKGTWKQIWMIFYKYVWIYPSKYGSHQSFCFMFCFWQIQYNYAFRNQSALRRVGLLRVDTWYLQYPMRNFTTPAFGYHQWIRNISLVGNDFVFPPAWTVLICDCKVEANWILASSLKKAHDQIVGCVSFALPLQNGPSFGAPQHWELIDNTCDTWGDGCPDSLCSQAMHSEKQ